MTIQSTTRITTPFIGSGVTVPTFPFTFKVFLASDILVLITSQPPALNLTSDYSVALNADQDASPGGTITLNPASTNPNIAGGILPVLTNMVITSQVPQLQSTTLTNFGGFFPTVINAALDRLTILVQQVAQTVGRVVSFPLTDTPGLNTLLPSALLRANKLQAFNADGSVGVSNLTLAQIEALAASGTNANAFYAATSAGTGNAATAVTGVTTLIGGQVFTVVMTAANTNAAPTFNPDGKGAKIIKQLIAGGKGALLNPAAGGQASYFAGYTAQFLYDGTDMILLNPAPVYGTQGNFQTGTDLTGTDAVNAYNQYDSYNPSSVVGAVGAVTNPGVSASTSGGTGTVPSNNAANDLIGGVNMYGYIAGAYQAAAAAVGRVVGAVAGNLGGQWEVWTKADNGVLTKQIQVNSDGSMTFTNPAGARSGLGAAASGANADITSLQAGVTGVKPTAGDATAKLATMSAFADGANGASRVLLSTQTASNSALLGFTIPSGYDVYELVYTNLVGVSAGGFGVNYSTNAGSTYITTGYHFAGQNCSDAASSAAAGATAGSNVPLASGGIATTAGIGISGELIMHGLADSTAQKLSTNRDSYFDGTNYRHETTGAVSTGAAAVNFLKISNTGGNISTGKASLYGYRNA